MSPRDLPGYPRARQRSHHDSDPPAEPERLWRALGELDQRVGGLEDAANENRQQNATIIKSLEDIKATDRHALTKLAFGLITTAIVTIGGVVGGLQVFKGPAPLPPIVRSALDVALDQCRPIQEPGSRAECFSRVFAMVPK